MNKIEVTGTVTKVHEFYTQQGYGIDIFLKETEGTETLYLQIVLYNETARKFFNLIQVDDNVKVSGRLKYKPYAKKDGTITASLIIERPNMLERLSQPSQELPGSNGDDTLNNFTDTDELPFD